MRFRRMTLQNCQIDFAFETRAPAPIPREPETHLIEIIGWKLSPAFLLSWHLVHPGGFSDNGNIGTQFKVWELVQRAIVKLVESRTNTTLNCRLRGNLPSWWDFHFILWVTFGFNVCRCSGVAMSFKTYPVDFCLKLATSFSRGPRLASHMLFNLNIFTFDGVLMNNLWCL